MITVRGVVAPLPDSLRVAWTAAAPPDRMTSFSGSGIPFVSPEQAFHDPQGGSVTVDRTGLFVVRLEAPNSFHVPGSECPVPPTLWLEWVSGGTPYRRAHAVADAAVPARSLRAACFGQEHAFPDVMNQEDYLLTERYASGGRP